MKTSSKNGIVYLFTNKLNGKKYVGQTCRDFDTRLKEHLRHNKTYFDKALSKYGVENFNYEILEEVDCADELNAREIAWIEKHNSIIPNGYNLCIGGGVTNGFKHTKESKVKMSITKKKSGAMIGEKNHYHGKKHSIEIRNKMSAKWTDERKSIQSKRSKEIDKNYLFVRVRNIDTNIIYNSVKDAADEYGVNSTHITAVCRGRQKTSGGARWEYV